MTVVNVPQGIALDITGIGKTFDGGVEAVRDVSIDLAPGEFVAMLGPSGCGKSTLLRLVAGLETPSTGRIRPSLDDRSGLAFVFQDAHLLPWRNVLSNVELPLELMQVDRRERRARATRAIADVGLEDAANRYPMQLSGGMRMRVSLARALVTRPRLLLLDEPFAALDELTRQHLDEQLLQLWEQLGMTVLFVTHSVSEAVFLAQRAIVFSPRPARLIADIPIDLPYPRTANLRSDARFAAAMGPVYAALRGPDDT